MPKALFNITYTLPTPPAHLHGNRRAQYIAERKFYNMTAEYNILSYMLNGKKVARNSTAEDYFTRGGTNGGLFNMDGAMSEKQVKDMKARLAETESIIWHGFISFDEETTQGMDSQEKAIKFMRQTFNSFLERTHMKKDNIELFATLHVDKAHHHHIHFGFFEKEPKRRDKEGNLCYTKRGKIDPVAIDNYLVSANMHLSEHGYEYYTARDRAMAKLREFTKVAVKKADISMAINSLREALPDTGRLQYNAANMAELRPQIDRVAELLIAASPECNSAHKDMLEQMARVRQEVQDLVRNNKLAYINGKRLGKDEIDRLTAGEHTDIPQSYVDMRNVDYIDNLESDYRARVGNVVLGMCKQLNQDDFRSRLRKNRSERIKSESKYRKRAVIMKHVMQVLADIDNGERANWIKSVQEIEREQEMTRIYGGAQGGY